VQRTDALTNVLTRDRIVVAAALSILTLLAWAYVVWLSTQMAMPAVAPATEATSGSMSGMDMSPSAPATDSMAGMDMAPSAPAADDMAGMDMGTSNPLAPSFRTWAPADFAFMFAMWSVMMVGMMTPSVAPMVLLYAAAGRKAKESGTPLAATGWFFAGYLAVWIGFSALATLAQWVLTTFALMTPMMATASAVLGGGLLVAAGLYQWTPLKGACLRVCQSPIEFLTTHGGFRAAPLGAVQLGIAHGTYCLGCCVALMSLLFFGGIMNLLWIFGLTVLILLEKIVPTGRLLPRISGALLGAAGIWMLAGAF
jgi:predicted metal-binding membrane protein